MTFHKQGIPTLILTLFVCALLTGGTYLLKMPWLHFIGVGLSLFLLIIVLQFFRSPKRKTPPNDDNVIYTPADGKVVVIEKAFEEEYLKTECIMISVFMSPLNVHINRNPVNGTVEYLKYHKGKYLVAWHPKSSTENERFTTVYNTKNGKVLIRQIAGALARRIVNDLEEGQTVTQSEEMGFIKFGSRVDVFVPLDAEVKVKLEDVVRAPGSVLATFGS